MMKQNIAPLVFLLVFVVPYIFAEEEEEEEGEEGEEDRTKLWKAHGLCASIAWAILVPLAIGSSMCRNMFEKVGVDESFWFKIHFTLNLIAALLTAAAFGIAVFLIREADGKSPWKEYPHFIVGLVVFILTMLQALMGMFRPHHAVSPIKEEQEEQEQAEEESEEGDTEVKLTEEKLTKENVHEKSTLRVMWEAKHRLFGVSLLGMAWYQLYSGWELFEEEDFGENMGKAWLGVGGGLLGVVFLLKAFTMIRN